MLKAQRLIDNLNQKFPGSTNLIVGGAVRDTMLGKLINDIDIATNIPIEDIIKEYSTVDIGASKDFGITLVRFENESFEVAQFRSEQGTYDNRHPNDVKMEQSFEADAARRDITINAMGLDNGNIVDYYGGKEDLENKIIRAVGDPEYRFEEDALRILRVARFAALLDFTIEPKTYEAMKKKSKLVESLSVERVMKELMKTSKSGDALARYIEILIDVGVLDYHFPEISGMIGFEHEPETHPEGGVYEHVISALHQSRSNNPLVNIAILFHDIGKPPCRTYKDNGWVAYKRHEYVGRKIWNKIAKRMKMSKEQQETIGFAIENHMVAHIMHKIKKGKIIALRQSPYWEVLMETMWADDASRVGMFNPDEFNARLARVEEVYKVIGEKEEFENKIREFISGHTIMNAANNIGIKLAGVDIGRIKKEVVSILVDCDFNITKNEVNNLVNRLVGQCHEGTTVECIV